MVKFLLAQATLTLIKTILSGVEQTQSKITASQSDVCMKNSFGTQQEGDIE